MSLGDAAGDGARRDLRPGRRRLLALRGRRHLDRPPLREDALRQRAARARLPARLAGLGRGAPAARCAARRSTGRCARCAAPRAASARRSTPTPRASRASSTSGRSSELRDALGEPLADDAIAYFGASERGNFERGSTCSRRRGAEPDATCREIRAQLLEARARARPARARRQAPDRLERADDLRAGRGRRGARARGLPRRGGRAAPTFVLDELRDADGRLLRTWKDGRGRLRAYLEDHAFLLEALITLYEATFDPRWYREAVRARRRDHRALRRPRARRLLHHRRRPRAARRAAQGPRGLADPVGQLGRRVRPAAARAALGRGQVRAPRAGRAAAALPDRRRATRRRSATCSRRSTSTSRRCARWRSSAEPEPASAAARSSATAYRPHLVLAGGDAPTACRCSRAASRSTAAPPRTCASTSPARRRSTATRRRAGACGARGMRGAAVSRVTARRSAPQERIGCYSTGR